VNPSTALARVLVDELVRCGVREAVLCPGSRNAPLSFALYDADARGDLRLHVRIDERTAGFLALGLAKAGGAPVAVVTTSGTAAVNLHPAVVEASHSGVPLVVLTADRPAEVRGSGANQTIDQVGLYGGAARWAVDVPAPEARAGQLAYWRATACRSVWTALGGGAAAPGPVHLNVGFREPRVPDADSAWPEPRDGRPDGAPWTWVTAAPAEPLDMEQLLGRYVERGLIVVGDEPSGEEWPDSPAVAVAALSAQSGWPVVAEPFADSRCPGALSHGALLLGDPAFAAAHRPDVVVLVGRPTLSRSTAAAVRSAADVVLVDPYERWSDPTRSVRQSVPVVPRMTGETERKTDWWRDWAGADRRAGRAVESVLAAETLCGPVVAREVVRAVPAGGVLVLGSSQPVRDVDLYAPLRHDVTVLANRGAAGIDGTVSTAVGAALASRGNPRSRAYALMGDLTFLHDSTGLLIGPDEPRPDLCIVVVNDDGGGIFGLLEQGAPEHSAPFERIFGTPTGADLAALCAGSRTPYQRVSSMEQLRTVLAPAPGLRVVEVRTDRRTARDLHARLRAAVAAALAP
jgi:2-succinyl-5-enolpyruvyl-6-hydroxy-3-cyclohexene-1-carboxylate synthase